MSRVTKRQLEEWLAFWQPALRLADWDIEVKACSRKKLEGDDAECYPYPELQEAEIRVVSSKPSSALTDHESILVHELLHCHIDRLRTETNGDVIELVVEILSKAFIGLRRSALAEQTREVA